MGKRREKYDVVGTGEKLSKKKRKSDYLLLPLDAHRCSYSVSPDCCLALALSIAASTFGSFMSGIPS